MYTNITPSSSNISNTTKCHEYTHANDYLISGILLLVALLFAFLRCIKWFRVRSELSLPLKICTALVVSLSLRASWCLLRYFEWYKMDTLNSEFMYILNRLPLLLQLSAFSAISLSWIANAQSTSNYFIFKTCILLCNAILYIMSLIAILLEWEDIHVIEKKDEMYHIVTLLVIASCCLGLSILFIVFGIRLRVKLYGSIHVSKRIRRSFNRIFYATVLCSMSFAFRAIIFIVTTVLYNILNICYSWNHYIYPTVVYAIPSTVTSIAILFIMDVDNAEVTNGRERGRDGGQASDSDSSDRYYGAVDG